MQSNQKRKTIQVQPDTWERLMKIKIMMRWSDLDSVIRMALDKQGA